jgi:sporulation protein YunB
MKQGFRAHGFRPKGQKRKNGFQSLKPKSSLRGWLIAFIAVLIVLAIAMSIVDIKLRPSIARASVAVATRVATEALNQAVTQELAQNADHAKLITFEGGAGPRDLTVTRLNLEAVTRIQSQATRRAEDSLKALSVQKIRLPIAHMLGGSVLSIADMNVPLRLSLLGNAHSSIAVDVKSVGVNQVVHILYLDISAQVNVVAPFVTAPIEVHSRSPIAYIVMSGSVPNSYYNSTAGNPPTNAGNPQKSVAPFLSKTTK